VLYTEEEEGDAELDESNGPVPDDLADEDEFEGDPAVCKGDEEGAPAETVDNGGREKAVLNGGEDLKVGLSMVL